MVLNRKINWLLEIYLVLLNKITSPPASWHKGTLVNVLVKQRLKSLFDIMGGRTLSKDVARLIALAQWKYGWGTIAAEKENVYMRCLGK